MPDNKNKPECTEEDKALAIKRMLSPEECSISKLHHESGIPESSLYTWRTKARQQPGLPQQSSEGGRRKIKTSQDKLRVVIETYTLTEVELGEYCRKQGLYLEDVNSWRRSCAEANDGRESASIKEINKEFQKEKEKNRRLESELTLVPYQDF